MLLKICVILSSKKRDITPLSFEIVINLIEMDDMHPEYIHVGFNKHDFVFIDVFDNLSGLWINQYEFITRDFSKTMGFNHLFTRR